MIFIFSYKKMNGENYLPCCDSKDYKVFPVDKRSRQPDNILAQMWCNEW